MRRQAAGEPAMRIECGRYGNPTQSAAERQIAALEGGEKALLDASEMCAITTTMLSLLCSGENRKHKAGGYTAGRLIMHGGNGRVRQNDSAIHRGKTKTE